MRIDLTQGSQPAPETSRTSARSGSATNNTSSSNGLGEDQAQLSGAHTQVQALAAQAAQLPEVREERVHALRQAIEGGRYRPDPEKIAGAMFAHMITTPA